MTSENPHEDFERIKAASGEFPMPPADAQYATIAMGNDTCGNLRQPDPTHRTEALVGTRR